MNGKKVAGLIGASAASFASVMLHRQALARVFKLPPVTHRVKVSKNVRIPVAPGVTLATDIYRPKSPIPLPAILIRTPYGRGGVLGALMIFVSQRFAERGYNVLMQDVRGRFDSGTNFTPYIHEGNDGAATIDWAIEQEWCDGNIGMWGPSYLGSVQWSAAAAHDGDNLKALVPIITQSQIGGPPEHSQPIDLIMRWMFLLETLEDPELSLRERIRRATRDDVQTEMIMPSLEHLPQGDMDERLFGKPKHFYREWMAHESPDDPYWDSVKITDNTPLAPPGFFIGGWYDIFLSGLVADYELQKAANKHPHLTIGPWKHIDAASQISTLGDVLAWYDAHLKGNYRLRSKPVKLYVMGANEWRSYNNWPPAGKPTPYFLHGSGSTGGQLLVDGASADDAPDTYLYDPANPTPNIGGALLTGSAGPADNRELEARADVLTFTTPRLDQPLEAIGIIELTLYVRSSREYADFFGRITDVHPDGQSINICDALFSLTPERGEPQPDGTCKVTFNLSPTAYRWQPGHRIRLQVSSGAFPRFARNLGTGESLVTGVDMVSAEQTIYHDADHPSAIILPIVS